MMHSFLLAFSILLGAPEAPSVLDRFMIETWTSERGLPQNTITSICQTGDGYLWFGSFAGLIRFDGKFVSIREQSGLCDNIISSILDDDLGDFGMFCNREIYWIARQGLNDSADGKIRHVYQTWWFYIACVLAVAAAGYGAVRWRVKRLESRRLELEQLVAERSRLLAEEIAVRKRTEADLESSLRDKEVLLKEIHHRVKNNMQVISSILNLHAKNVPDGQVLDIFRECQNRIKSMAFVHEKLYRSQTLSRIQFADYIQDLVVHLLHSHQMNPDAVKIRLELEALSLNINTAIPCGLIVNELITNAFKHAFPGGRKGELFVGFGWLKEDLLQIVVKDDGVGFPANIDIRNTQSLGMQITTLLTAQLRGTVDLIRDGGTEFRIAFREQKSNQ